MNDNVTFRQTPEPTEPRPDLPEPEVNKDHAVSSEDDKEPVELRDTGGRSVVLDSLGISSHIQELPEADKQNVNEVKDYVLGIIKAKGLSPTVSAFKKTLDGLREEMGLEDESEPSIVLDRISGVVKAWRDMSFIKDPAEKRKIFYRLAKLQSSEDMNKEVFRLMNERKVWL